MNDLNYEVCAIMQPYRLGEAVVFEQKLPVPIDLFSLRKYLERLDLNMYTVSIAKIKNPVAYAFMFDVSEFGFTTKEEYFAFMSQRLNCENKIEVISRKLQEILTKFLYENENVNY